MARIKNTNVYVFDTVPEASSFLVGSDQGDGRITKSYRIDTVFGLLPSYGYFTDAPADGQPYLRQDNSWVLVPPSGVGSVFSVFGRIGAVTGQVGDYSAFYSQLGHTHTESDITDLQAYLLPTDIGTTVQGWSAALDAVSGTNTGDQTSIVGISSTKAQFNTALTDGAFKFSGDAPTAHTHVEADITDLQAYLLPTSIDTLAKLNAIVTDATLIDTADARLSDARTPLAHTHVEADITDLQAYLTSVDIADINTVSGVPSASTWLRGDGVWGTILAGVSSVFGRTADVVAQTGDYDSFYVDFVSNQYGIGGEKTFTGAVQLFDGRVGVQTPVFGPSRLGDSAFQAPTIDTNTLVFKDGTTQNTALAIFPTAVGGSDGYVVTWKNFVDDVFVFSVSGIGNADYTDGLREVETTFGLRNDYTAGQFTVFDTFNQDYPSGTSVDVRQKQGWVAIHGGGAAAKPIGLWRYDTTTYTNIFEVSTSNVFNFGVPDVQVSGNQVWHSGNDGAGSGLDADTVDGIESSFFTTRNDSIITTQDWDTFTSNNHYRVANASGANKAPGAGFGSLIVHSANAIITQTFYNNTNSGNNGVWYRTKYSTNAWGAWARLWTDLGDGAGSGLDADLWDGVQRPDNLGNVTSSYDVLDANLIEAVGESRFYRNPANGSTNVPDTGDGYLFQMAQGDLAGARGAQLAVTRNTNSMFFRRDDGTWNEVWHSGNDGVGSGLNADLFHGFERTASGNRWGVISPVETSGVLEIGRYIDFHNTDGDTNDNTCRIDNITNGQLRQSSSATTERYEVYNSSTEFVRIEANTSGGAVVISDDGSSDTVLRGYGNSDFYYTITATNFILRSDERLKHDIELYETKPINVDWKTFVLNSDKTERVQLGAIAQELEKKHPEFVITNDKDEKSIAYIDLLIAKVSELEERIRELEK